MKKWIEKKHASRPSFYTLTFLMFSPSPRAEAAPKAMIIGAPDMHVDKGSTINLTCIIAHSPEPPGHIFWYHNGKVRSFNSTVFFGLCEGEALIMIEVWWVMTVLDWLGYQVKVVCWSACWYKDVGLHIYVASWNENFHEIFGLFFYWFIYFIYTRIIS